MVACSCARVLAWGLHLRPPTYQSLMYARAHPPHLTPTQPDSHLPPCTRTHLQARTHLTIMHPHTPYTQQPPNLCIHSIAEGSMSLAPKLCMHTIAEGSIPLPGGGGPARPS